MVWWFGGLSSWQDLHENQQMDQPVLDFKTPDELRSLVDLSLPSTSSGIDGSFKKKKKKGDPDDDDVLMMDDTFGFCVENRYREADRRDSQVQS